MYLRFHSLLLAVLLLIMLNACSTTGPRPAVEAPVAPELPDQTTDQSVTTFDRRLAEVTELSSSMTGYQPDVAMEIMRSLESVPSGLLETMIDSQLYDPELTDWLELSLQVRTLLINGSSVKAAARTWANYHYGHSITAANFPELVSSYSTLFPVPALVAILLPTEGSLDAVARAIRDGILSAYLERPGDAVIRFYSSGNDAESAIAAYLQAKKDGATQIIGPLRIESTRALSGLTDLSIPTLLLNDAGSDQPVRAGLINSLAMSRTEEATAIARSALAQGQDKALVIVPDSPWGTRMETAFASEFEQGEGHISATTHFDTSAADHSAMLTQVLKIDESKQRKTDLQSRLGIPLTFEPSRRDDFDFIFMVAKPVEGRELKPLLRFHDAGDIPVYAMSRIFSGKVNQATDHDLNGIVFPTTRWQLETPTTATLELASIRGGAMGNFYALGQDAWRLLPWLPLMQKDPDLWFPGDVGSLRLQANGQLYRQPAWAQFSAGRPVAYQWPDNH